MGATGWSYIVPYQDDVTAALKSLQADVFDREDYEKPIIDMDFLDEMSFFDVDEETREGLLTEYTLGPLREPIRQFGVDGLRTLLEALDESPAVLTREELDALKCLSCSGTGSILDMGGVSPEPANWAISPLPREQLIAVFGTDQPTRDMLPIWQRRWDEWNLGDPPRSLPYERDRGIYFALYQDGRPSEIYIEGMSSD